MPAAARCVYCHTQPVVPRWKPFCSERCKMADLGHWIGGDYRIATTEARDSHDGGTRAHETDDGDE